MSDTIVLRLGRDALVTALLVGGPILGVSLAIGLLVSVVQAATQISEQTLSFVPKIIGVLVTLVIFGPWMITSLTDFARRVFALLPAITR